MNVCCHRPVDNATPTWEQMLIGRERLLQELLEYRPDVILTVGNTAAGAIMNDKFVKITQIRGLWTEFRANWSSSDYSLLRGATPVFSTFHPAAMLRSPQDFPDFARDLQTVCNDPPKPISPNVIIVRPERDNVLNAIGAMIMMAKCPDDMPHCRIVSVDIETSGFLNDSESRILSIAFSPNSTISYIFPDTLLEDPWVIQQLNMFGACGKVYFAGHNAINFDYPMMLTRLGIKIPISNDTMLQHYLVDERKGTHSLKRIARDYYQMPDYSVGLEKYLQEEGTTYADIPRHELYQYQGMDTAINHQLACDLQSKMRNEDTAKAYPQLHDLAYTLMEVEQHGALIDQRILSELEDKWSAQVDTWINELSLETNRPGFNPRSSKQLAEVLFDELDMEVIATTKAGNRATGKAILEKLRITDDTGICNKVIQTRSLAQNLSTYVRGLRGRIDTDGRVRSHFLLFGTETSRLASRNPNLQNIPKHPEKNGVKLFGYEVRKAFIPSPGKVFIEADYSQLELRVAAWYSEDPIMLQAYHDGIDIHKVVASKIFQVPLDKVNKEQRFVAKFVDFGIVYGRQAQSLAEEELKEITGGSVKKAQAFIDDFLNEFPTLRDWITTTRAKALKDGYVENMFGYRRRWDLIINSNRADVEREAINTPIQGAASTICLLALQRIHRELPHDKVKVLFPVHDSILMEVDESEAELWKPIIQGIMEDPPIEKKLPFTVDISIAKDWASFWD